MGRIQIRALIVENWFNLSHTWADQMCVFVCEKCEKEKGEKERDKRVLKVK